MFQTNWLFTSVLSAETNLASHIMPKNEQVISC